MQSHRQSLPNNNLSTNRSLHFSLLGSNQLPLRNHYNMPNAGVPFPNVDDLSEYRGGMERYQLSHRLSYDRDTDDEDDYIRRHHFRVVDEDDEDDDKDFDEDYDDVYGDDGKKKSSIGKPRHNERKHMKKHFFKSAINSTTIDHTKHKKVPVKPKAKETKGKGAAKSW